MDAVTTLHLAIEVLRTRAMPNFRSVGAPSLIADIACAVLAPARRSGGRRWT